MDIHNHRKLKISGPINLTQARFGAGVLSHFLGFNFSFSNPNFIDPEKIKEISGWIQGPELVGVFTDQDSIDYILSVSEDLYINYVEIKDRDIEEVKTLSENDLSIFYYLKENDLSIIQEIMKEVEFLILDESIIFSNLEFFESFDKSDIFINLEVENNQLASLMDLGFNNFNICLSSLLEEDSTQYETISDMADIILE